MFYDRVKREDLIFTLLYSITILNLFFTGEKSHFQMH